MKESTERYVHYEPLEFDRLIVDIGRGAVKCGKYAKLVKVRGGKRREDIMNDERTKFPVAHNG